MADQIRFGNFNRNFPIINGKDLEDAVKADQASSATGKPTKAVKLVKVTHDANGVPYSRPTYVEQPID
jgi:hypothetical protein